MEEINSQKENPKAHVSMNQAKKLLKNPNKQFSKKSRVFEKCPECGNPQVKFQQSRRCVCIIEVVYAQCIVCTMYK